jgi:Serine carboxypeptidase S28
LDRTSSNYCPVITFGGSYPGFLSTMMRFRFPDIVDIGYAASAPLQLYSQVVDSNAYYDKACNV